MNTILILLIFCHLSLVTLALELDPLAGPYCGINNICCTGREDECSHKVITEYGDTMCYCDDFCSRPDGRGDCCLDYPSVCGAGPTTPVPTTEPPPETTPPVTETTPAPANLTDCKSCDDDTDEECSEHRCLIEDYIVKQVNGADLGWQAASYNQFYGKKLRDGLIYKLGTFERSPALSRLGAEHYDRDEPYLKEFHVKMRWPHLITPIMDQGWCGSDWAVSLATIVSDRYAIQSNGAEKVQLSPQTLLSCNVRRQQGCRGGHIDTAWKFAQVHGLVDEDCFPYVANKTSCPLKPEGNLVTDGCKSVLPDRKERYKVGPPFRLAAERDVMYDILHSGPIQAMMEVYQDFFHYKSGVYRHSKYGDQILKGYHSVRMVGWGEENGQKFWVIANSWGTEWGEDGYFRIARGVNESGIESFMVSVLCDVTESIL